MGRCVACENDPDVEASWFGSVWGTPGAAGAAAASPRFCGNDEHVQRERRRTWRSRVRLGFIGLIAACVMFAAVFKGGIGGVTGRMEQPDLAANSGVPGEANRDGAVHSSASAAPRSVLARALLSSPIEGDGSSSGSGLEGGLGGGAGRGTARGADGVAHGGLASAPNGTHPRACNSTGPDSCDSSGMKKVAANLQCDFCDCSDKKQGLFNYLSFQECGMEGYSVFGYLLLVLWLAYLLYLLGDTADEFFCPTLQAAVTILNLSPNVAGVTFLSFGNGAPDVFSALVAGDLPSLMIGALVGAGIFVTTVVVGAVALNSDCKVNRRPFVRDAAFYTLSTCYLFLVFQDNLVTLPESLGFLAIYAVFATVVIVGRYIYQKQKHRRHASRAALTGQPSAIGLDGTEPSDMVLLAAGVPDSRAERDFLDGREPRAAGGAGDGGDGSDGDGSAGGRVTFGAGTGGGAAATAEEDEFPRIQRSASHGHIQDLLKRTQKRRPTRQALALPAAATTSNPAGSGPSLWRDASAPLTAVAAPGRHFRSFDGDSVQMDELWESRFFRKRRHWTLNYMAALSSDVDELLARVGENIRQHPGGHEVESMHMESTVTDSTGVTDWCKEFRDAEWYVKLWDLIQVPGNLVRDLTIPRVDEDSWNIHFATANPICGGLMLAYNVAPGSWTDRIVADIPINWLEAAAVLGVLFAGLTYWKAPRDHPPSGGCTRVVWLLFSFVMSVVWIVMIANEVVGVLFTFGALTGIPKSVLGLTVLAWGNSLGDLVADVTVAKADMPAMAIAGTFAGPMFNMLVGLGLSMSVAILAKGQHIDLQGDKSEDPTNERLLTYVMFATLLLSLVLSLIVVPLSRFTFTRLWGKLLIAFYVVFLGVAITIVLEKGNLKA